MTDNSGQEKNITVKRRRQGASSGPQSSERAEAPSRQRREGSSPPNRPGGGQNPQKLPLWMVVLLIIGFIAYNLIFGAPPASSPQDESSTGFETQPQQQEAIRQPTATRANTRTAPASQPQAAASDQTWTVMIYQDADDRILEQDIYLDLNEAERVGSSDQVNIVAQVDRFKGAYSGDGNWTGTRRYYITQDNDLQKVHSELVEDLGELNMADGKTLVDFVLWAARTYPADKYALILSDHGMGWPGGFSDPDPVSRDPSRTALASALGDDNLFLMELEDSLAEILDKSKIDKLELIGMDACLMGHLEVLAALEPYADYAVLSQETEPALGWAYTSFLQALVDNPGMDGAQLSQSIIKSYIKDDQRINDEEARAEFLRQGSPLGGLFGSASQVTAASLARELGRDVTLTAVDLSEMQALISSVNTLSYNLQNENQDLVAKARTYAPAFTNVFGKDTASPYIDLGGFVQMLKKAGISSKTRQAADEVLANIQNAVVAEMHGEGKRGATGISIYFPNSTLYRSPVAGPQSYTTIARRFAQVSLWDDFLVFFYNDISFKPEPGPSVLPQPGAPSRSPGLGQIEVAPISLSGRAASPGNPVTLTTRISGKNIGYIYLFVGLYDQSASSIFKADTDYLESPNTQELNGVYYPQWNDDQPFNMTFEWEPTLFQITDGETSATALFNPQVYGASAADAVYVVEGIYHYSDGSSRSARIHFRDGKAQQVFGFTDTNQTGGVREIIPQAGDTFTILENWLDLDSAGRVTQSITQEGPVLTFSDRPFEWKEVYAPAGDYVVGFIVQDLDGNVQQIYTTVTVQ